MRTYQFIKRFRVILSLLVLIGITCFFTAVRIQNVQWLSWLLKVQVVPAFLSAFIASLWVLIALLLLTLFFGRIYCSLLCPMGIFQDVVIRISNLFKTKKQKRFRYVKESRWLRYSILTITVALWIVGFGLPLLLLDPNSNYGRIATHLFKPVTTLFNNGLHYIWPGSFYYQSHVAVSVLSYLLPVAIFITIVVMSALKGRLFCNTICPVGSLLGFISKYAAFRPVINKTACNHCAVCATKCKAECINSKEQHIDHSRCVGCFNCTVACSQGAITYAFCWHKKSYPSLLNAQTAQARRNFLTSSGVIVATAAVYRASGGKLLTFTPSPTTVAPPGARSLDHLKKLCTACQACVAACPMRIIQPTITGYGLDGLMFPAIAFKNGFCSYECNRCNQVCPSFALERTTIEEKKVIRIGKARFTPRRCVVTTDGTDCGACDEHCPTKAIRMVPFGNKGLLRPQVDETYCIGCGACEFICPTTPKAIVVLAENIHSVALSPMIEKQEQKKVDDFGF